MNGLPKSEIADLYQRISLMLKYLGYEARCMEVCKRSYAVTIHSIEGQALMPTPLQCEQLNAVTNALEELGYRVKDAFMDKDGTIRVTPKRDDDALETSPNGWRKIS
ncbi:MAG: hypothetical protein ABJO09_00890 [Hyphomicrobiales bacterium]